MSIISTLFIGLIIGAIALFLIIGLPLAMGKILGFLCAMFMNEFRETYKNWTFTK